MSSRRDVLLSGAAIASGLLAGCSAPDDPTKPDQGGPVDVAKADVPVGGGLVLQDKRVVVTQPQEGTFLAFSARCTHSGCLVKSVRDDGIYCACHGSLFGVSDGEPTQGPATEPLRALTLTENGDTLTVQS